jgi:hypothetical protein
VRRKLHQAILEADRLDDIAGGGPICVGCRWSCDDPELELCCDCADAEFMKQILRGDYGRDEREQATRTA